MAVLITTVRLYNFKQQCDPISTELQTQFSTPAQLHSPDMPGCVSSLESLVACPFSLASRMAIPCLDRRLQLYSVIMCNRVCISVCTRLCQCNGSAPECGLVGMHRIVPLF